MRLDHRTFLYSASVLAVSNIGLQALGFVYRIALSHFAGPEGLGVYRLVFSAYTVVNAACLSGVTLACSRLGASLQARGEPGRIRVLARIASGLFLLIFTGCAAVVLPFHNFIAARLLGDTRTALALPIMLVCLLLTGIENIVKAVFLGTGRVQYAAASETGEQVIRIVAVVGLLAAFGGNDYARIAALILLGMTMSECFSAALLGYLYHRHIARAFPLPKHGSRGLLPHVLEIALPLSAAAIAGNVISSASAVILPGRLVASGLTEDGAVGALGVVSGMASPLILLPIALISAVTSVLMPSVSAAHARGDTARVRGLSEKALAVTGLVGLPATAAIVPLAPSLARLFFAQSIPLPYMALLGVSAVLTYYEIVTASLLNGVNAQRRAVAAAVGGELLQLALTWLLAARPELGIYGYLLAMTVSPALVVAVNLYGLCALTGLRIQGWRAFGLPALCGAVVYGWVRIFYVFFLGVAGAQWCAALLAAATAAAFYFALLHLLGVHVGAYISRRLVRLPSLFGFF